MDKKEYIYEDSSGVEHKKAISDQDFALKQKDEKIHDQKFKTKPTTFFKDAVKRFAKNKSSVAGGIILGILLLLSVIIPFVDVNNIDVSHPYELFLAAKLFDAGTGFWDGTKEITNAPCDVTRRETDEEGNVYYYPYEATYPKRAVSKLTPAKVGYLEDATAAASYGYANIILQGDVLYEAIDLNNEEEIAKYATYFNSQNHNFDVNDFYTVRITLLGEEIDGFARADYRVVLDYKVNTIEERRKAVLKDFNDESLITNAAIDDGVNILRTKVLTIEDFMDSVRSDADVVANGLENANIRIEALPILNADHSSLPIRSVEFASANDTSVSFINLGFTNANEMILKKSNERGYWTSNGTKRLYHGLGYVCNFVFDTYEAAYGIQERTLSLTEINEYVEKGWISSDFNIEDALYNDAALELDNYYQTLRTDKTEKYCPIVSMKEISVTTSGEITAYTFICDVYGYRWLGYSEVPKFLFGTDSTGNDLLKLVFVGLRTSLALGLMTFAICFTIGLIWGSICGYFGGTVDLLMERFTDILSGIPWIVIMTLCILNLGSNFFTFILAMCMTGWIRTASITRTQFYRFRDREYTLASRTLGATHPRLIFRHILPNAMGTIITSSVLMIPSVIFSEATISYLGLGFQSMHSLGVILSTNQTYLLTNPVLILFPSIIMALIMISFNLFGNGLRDAFNPSLKGSD
ncbi:MAG: ABC transporter permease [Bacilli bacterium]|nr:ABC transporter permease [Bacilli bacterium]